MKILKTKELPKDTRGRKLKYPFDKITVGKYLELPCSTKSQIKQYHVAVRAAYYYAGRQTPAWKFVSRVVNGVGGIHRVE